MLAVRACKALKNNLKAGHEEQDIRIGYERGVRVTTKLKFHLPVSCLSYFACTDYCFDTQGEWCTLNPGLTVLKKQNRTKQKKQTLMLRNYDLVKVLYTLPLP